MASEKKVPKRRSDTATIFRLFWVVKTPSQYGVFSGSSRMVLVSATVTGAAMGPVACQSGLCR